MVQDVHWAQVCVLGIVNFEKRDFVLTEYADGRDNPGCFAEMDTERSACSSPWFRRPRCPVIHHKNTYLLPAHQGV